MDGISRERFFELYPLMKRNISYILQGAYMPKQGRDIVQEEVSWTAAAERLCLLVAQVFRDSERARAVCSTLSMGMTGVVLLSPVESCSLMNQASSGGGAFAQLLSSEFIQDNFKLGAVSLVFALSFSLSSGCVGILAGDIDAALQE